MSKNKTIATVNATPGAAVEQKVVKHTGPKPEFMNFYNPVTRESYQNSIMVALPAAHLREMLASGGETICVCELQYSHFLKGWDAKAKRADKSFIGVDILKPVSGQKEFKLVKRTVIGDIVKSNKKYVMLPVIEEAAAKQAISC